MDINAEYHKRASNLGMEKQRTYLQYEISKPDVIRKDLETAKRGWKRQKKEILKRWMSGKKKLKLIRKCWKTAKYLPCFTMIFLTPFRTEQHSAVSVPSFGRVNGNIRKIFPLECAS